MMRPGKEDCSTFERDLPQVLRVFADVEGGRFSGEAQWTFHWMA